MALESSILHSHLGKFEECLVDHSEEYGEPSYQNVNDIKELELQ